MSGAHGEDSFKPLIFPPGPGSVDHGCDRNPAAALLSKGKPSASLPPSPLGAPLHVTGRVPLPLPSAAPEMPVKEGRGGGDRNLSKWRDPGIVEERAPVREPVTVLGTVRGPRPSSCIA